MNNVTYFIHLLILLFVQLTILDNIQIHSYVYINIYILAIYILPYRVQKTAILLFGFSLGFLVDLANHTMGIHTAATTLLAYIRPSLLLFTSNREQLDEIHGKQKISEFNWFFKYILLNNTIFNFVLIFGEAFSFNNLWITLARIVLSTLVSTLCMLLYYFITLKKKQN